MGTLSKKLLAVAVIVFAGTVLLFCTGTAFSAYAPGFTEQFNTNSANETILSQDYPQYSWYFWNSTGQAADQQLVLTCPGPNSNWGYCFLATFAPYLPSSTVSVDLTCSVSDSGHQFGIYLYRREFPGHCLDLLFLRFCLPQMPDGTQYRYRFHSSAGVCPGALKGCRRRERQLHRHPDRCQ